MPAPEILQQLYSLKTSSPDFLRVLWAFIKNDEDEKFSSGLEGEELTQLIDFLDNALDTIPPSDDVFRQCLRKLRAICGHHMVLPSSHVITGDLVRTGESAFAYGGFADVWEGDHGGNKVCIKALRVSLHDTQGLSKPFFKEAVVWKRLSHPNVVPFLGVTKEPLQFISEWMPNGTLTHYVCKNTSANRIALLLDAAEGLNYLHASYTIHGDLKGPNILINRDGRACLADFGLASVAQGHNSIASHAHGYTARWTAPEILKGAEAITREADMFSFGMVVIEAFTGKHPLSEWNASSVMMKIMGGERPMYPFGAQKLGFVEPIWDMTINCWQHDPSRRPPIANVVEFLRECYTVHGTDPSMSTLAPWKPSGSTGNSSAYGVISPAFQDIIACPPSSPVSLEDSMSDELRNYTYPDRYPIGGTGEKDLPPATPGGSGPSKRHGKKEKQPPLTPTKTKGLWSALLVVMRIRRMVRSRGSAGDSSSCGLISLTMPDSSGSPTWSPPRQNSGFPMLPIHERPQTQSSTSRVLPRSTFEDLVSDESRNHTHPRDSSKEHPVSGDRPCPTTQAFETSHTSGTLPAIISSKDEDAMVRSLPLEDAQTFVDMMDETLSTPGLPPSAQNKSLKLLYRACGRHAIIPSTLKVQVNYDRNSDALYRGGYADVWKGECSGQDVAVKVIRLYSKDVLQKVLDKFCREAVVWKSLQHPNILPLIGVVMSETRFELVSAWMENGNINEFIEAHPNADRLELLADTAEGLIYLHGNGMIHGDLKGVNILIDETYHARLADFGLLTIVSDPAHLIPSSSHGPGGTIRWMSPELIAPEKFELTKSRLTKSSDCYALGMVIYETISGKVPFHEYADTVVSVKVMLGEHPPRSAMFPEDLWKIIKSCWTSRPGDRPSVADVLQCLRAASNPSGPPPDGPSGVQSQTSDTATAKRSAPMLGLSHVTDRRLGSFSSPPRTLATEATDSNGEVAHEDSPVSAGILPALVLEELQTAEGDTTPARETPDTANDTDSVQRYTGSSATSPARGVIATDVPSGIPPNTAVGVLNVFFRSVPVIRDTGVVYSDRNLRVSLTLEGGDGLANTEHKPRLSHITWMETKLLLVNSPHESLVLRALHINDDQDLILMGSASFDIYALKRNATEDNIIVPISNNGKQLGKLQIDVKFYPIIPLPEINRGTVQRVPQTNVGIVRLVLYQAKDLDHSGRMSVEVCLDNCSTPINTSNCLLDTNNPVWESAKEFLCASKMTSVVTIKVIENRKSPENQLAGYMSVRLIDLLRADQAASGNWWSLSGSESGRIRLSSEWMPLGLGLHGIEQYVQPIGVVRLWLKKATDFGIIEAAWDGKCDPYIRVLVNGVIGARTNVINSLNLIWDQIIHVPGNKAVVHNDVIPHNYLIVHSLKETLYFECVDYQTDRCLGYTELHVSELATDADSVSYPYRSIGKTVEVAHLKLENGAFQGQLHYEAEFIPAVVLKGLKFSTSGRHIRRAVECANRDAADGNTSLNFAHKAAEAVPTGITTHRPLAEEKRNNHKNKESIVPALATDDGLDSDSVTGFPSNSWGKDKSGDGVTMSEEDLMKYPSGIIIFHVTATDFVREGHLEVLLEDPYWPSFTIPVARRSKMAWDYVGEGFVRHLQSSRLWLRFHGADEGMKDDVVAEWDGSVEEFLQQAMHQPVNRPLCNHNGSPSGTVGLEARYIPIPLELEPREKVDNQGVLRVQLLDAKGVCPMSQSGKPDSYVVFTLNGQVVYQSQVKEKTLHPEWNETFSVIILSRITANFQLAIFDAKWFGLESFGTATINLCEPGIFQGMEKTIHLNSDSHGDKGQVRLQLTFLEEVIVKSRTKTLTFPTSKAITWISSLPIQVGNGIFRGVVEVTCVAAKIGSTKSGRSYYVTFMSGGVEQRTSHSTWLAFRSDCFSWDEKCTFDLVDPRQQIKAFIYRYKFIGRDEFVGGGEIDIWRHLNPAHNVFSSEVLLRISADKELRVRLEYREHRQPPAKEPKNTEDTDLPS